MKLISARVRHFRIIRDSGLLQLESPSGLALLGAPNESGKSTLAEAIHTCLFVLHRTGGETFLNAIRPKPATGEHPEVTVEFEAGGGKHQLRKVFKGGRTSVAELTLPGGSTLLGEDAEKRLGELTGHMPGNAANREKAWAHLWVWQGGAGDDPLGDNLPKDRLDQRLAREGAGGVLRSETDSRVMAQVDSLWEETYTATNRVRANSDLQKAEAALQEARERQTAAQAELNRLETDINAKVDAQRRLDEAKQGLQRVEPEWERAHQQSETLANLRGQLEEAKRQVEAASVALARLVKANQEIGDKQTRAAGLRQAMEPAEREVQALLEQVRAAESRQSGLEEATAKATRAEEVARLQRELAQACVDLLAHEKTLARLEGLQADADKVRAEIAELEGQLAALPPVDEKALSRLNGLEKESLLAEASLKAMALELELARANLPVALNGAPVSEGTITLVTSGAELTVGEGVLIRLSPGGAETLAQTMRDAERARAALSEGLARCQVESLAIATRARDQRVDLEARLGGAKRQLNAMGMEQLGQELSEARRLKTIRQGEKERLAALAPDSVIPTADGIAAWLQASKDGERDAQAASQQVNTEFQGLARRVTQLREQWGKAKEALERNQASLTDLEGGLSLLVAEHGETDQRRAALGEAQARHLGLQAIAQTIQDQIQALNPEELQAALTRLKRSREQLATQLAEATHQKATLDGKLSVFSSDDPRAEVLAADQRLNVLEADHRAKKVRAEGIQLLRDEFQRAAGEVGQEVLRPLLERVNRLARIVFGHGAELRVTTTGESLGGLELYRPERGLHAFADLSAGTREQVAGIFRLALAGLLAADHEGCLPILLDDSFVNADPGRLGRMHAMLDTAASEGLQVILITCDLLTHATLGARQIDLTGLSRNLATPGSAGPAVVGGNPPEDPETSDADNDGNTIAMSASPAVTSRRARKSDGGQQVDK